MSARRACVCVSVRSVSTDRTGCTFTAGEPIMIAPDLQPRTGFTAHIDKSVGHAGRQATVPADSERIHGVLPPPVKRGALWRSFSTQFWWAVSSRARFTNPGIFPRRLLPRSTIERGVSAARSFALRFSVCHFGCFCN